MRRNPYPSHYRTAFAFSALPCPHRPQRSLRSVCPEGQRYGFTVFRVVRMNGLGSASSPVACLSVLLHYLRSSPRYIPFWVRPVSAFGLLTITTFISSSDSLTLPSSLAPPPHWHLQRHVHLTISMWLAPGYIVSVASYQAVTSFACTDRLRATERPVSFRPTSAAKQRTTRLSRRTNKFVTTSAIKVSLRIDT